MKIEEYEKVLNSIQEKIGDENSGLIADDLGTLLTDYQELNENLNNKNTQIEELNKTKEMLVSTNGKLLQQVGMGIIKPEPEEDTKPKEPFNFKNCFDEKRKF